LNSQNWRSPFGTHGQTKNGRFFWAIGAGQILLL
jgi:hypothetical protein